MMLNQGKICFEYDSSFMGHTHRKSVQSTQHQYLDFSLNCMEQLRHRFKRFSISLNCLNLTAQETQTFLFGVVRCRPSSSSLKTCSTHEAIDQNPLNGDFLSTKISFYKLTHRWVFHSKLVHHQEQCLFCDFYQYEL